MNHFEERLNTHLLNVYRSIEKLEADMLLATRGIPLSISELHLLEAVVDLGGKDRGATISAISAALEISLPSVTLAVNKLVRKGYVIKEKAEGDGRVVYVKPTRQGIKAEHAHQYFHRRMIRAVTQELEDTEKDALLKGVLKLEDFLVRNLDSYKENT